MPFIVMTASTPSRGGKYRKIAVVETSLPPGETPYRIDVKAPGLVRIVHLWDRLSVGATRHSAYFRALDKAEEMVKQLTVEKAIELKRERIAETHP